MAVKYRVDYRDNFNQRCRVDISPVAPYSGAIIPLRGVEGQACVISYDCGDDPYEPIINSKASINVFQTEGNPIDILELQQANDRDFVVEFSVDSELKWKGFLIPDGIQQTFQSAPFELNITATDGLKLLDTLDYTHNNLQGGRCILNYFRQILFATNNLGMPLPIRWSCAVTNPAFPGEFDIFSGSVEWAPRGEGFTDYIGNYKSCLYILENMLRSLQCRMHQSNGAWEIERINDIVTGSSVYREIPATLEGFSVTTLPLSPNLFTIGGDNTYNYRFVEEDAIITVLPALRTVVSTYEQDQRDNILPNGNMDIVSFSVPIYWGLYNASAGAYIESVGSLSDSAGSAVQITNPSPNGATGFQLFNPNLPIDSDVLYTYINFGFKFAIVNGATLDANGFIVWASTSFKFQVLYCSGDNVNYYLNENGFWTPSFTSISITVPGLKLNDVAQIDFNAKQNIILPLPNSSPIGRTRDPSLLVSFEIPTGRKVIFDDIYINTDNNNDVYEATYAQGNNTKKEEYSLNISSSHNGFYVSNYMTEYSQSGFEKFFTDSKYTGTLTALNSHAVLRNRYKSSLVFEGSIYASNWSYGEIYQIQTLTGKNFLPLSASWNTETNVVNMSCVEVRDDNISISMKHYGKFVTPN